MSDKSAMMRELLAEHGIVLDPERPPRVTSARPVDVVIDEATRDQIREILIANDAHADDVEWLTQSCPSLSAALRYRPPAIVRLDEVDE